jgi:hypothetical protein
MCGFLLSCRIRRRFGSIKEFRPIEIKMQEREETKTKGKGLRANLTDNKPEESGGITVAK